MLVGLKVLKYKIVGSIAKQALVVVKLFLIERTLSISPERTFNRVCAISNF